jgi:hypothetical protein
MVITFFLIIFIFIIKLYVGSNFSKITPNQNTIIIYGLNKGVRSSIVDKLKNYFQNIYGEKEISNVSMVYHSKFIKKTKKNKIFKNVNYELVNESINNDPNINDLENHIGIALVSFENSSIMFECLQNFYLKKTKFFNEELNTKNWEIHLKPSKFINKYQINSIFIIWVHFIINS